MVLLPKPPSTVDGLAPKVPVRYAVLGWSDGANSAVHLAALYPERVTRLALWGANVEITAEDVPAPWGR